MRTPAQAIAEILERTPVGDTQEDVALESAEGRVLARDAHADLDIPPFEKSAMDGYAVKSGDFTGAGSAPRTLRVVGESRAGTPFEGSVRAGECVAIYTGAELPADCDAVVMVEKSTPDGSGVRLDDRPARGQHVCARGEDLRAGAVLLRRGRRLSPIDLAGLAAIGCDPAPVFRMPRVGVITTGDELVRARERPGRGQIREGNTFYLAARARTSGALVENLGIVRDDPALLALRFAALLERNDLVITTGGVSMGKYDFVGDVLERCGVQGVFHKVAIKPGKPVWFGMRGRVPVFGLPGNPVSCLIGFEVFVRPALAKLAGASDEIEARFERGRWIGAATKPNPRQQNLPVRVARAADGVAELEPLPWSSSADITRLTQADGLAVVEAGDVLARGAMTDYRPLR
jgi:molybdopterin molybdotransferase